MSWYSSDTDLDMYRTVYGIDVASHGLGEDVRLLCDGRAAYLSPKEARALAGALLRQAAITEGNDERNLRDAEATP